MPRWDLTVICTVKSHPTARKRAKWPFAAFARLSHPAAVFSRTPGALE
jgi:hypothetical protein